MGNIASFGLKIGLSLLLSLVSLAQNQIEAATESPLLFSADPKEQVVMGFAAILTVNSGSPDCRVAKFARVNFYSGSGCTGFVAGGIRNSPYAGDVSSLSFANSA